MFSIRFLVLLLLVPLSSSWTCGVTPSWQKEHFMSLNHTRQLSDTPALERDSVLAPLRLHAYFAPNFNLNNDNITNILKQTIMPGVIQWYADILKVYSVKGNLVLNNANCYNYSIPAEHLTVGIPDSDVVIYLVSGDSTDNWIARAIGCDFDGGNSKHSPIAGFLEINQQYYNEYVLPVEMQVSVIRHEIAHILAIDPEYTATFQKPDGTTYENPIVNITVRDTEVTILTTPNVVSKARAAFGCDSLQGVELENYGGAGSAGAHWEKRIMMNDFMTAAIVADMIYSDITFAMFEDSGWYSVDYTRTDQIRYGRGEGCKFITSKCVVDGVAQLPDFCGNSSNEDCDIYHRRKSNCFLKHWPTSLPSQYQYFSDPTLGGVDPFADFCPYQFPYSDGDCRGRGVYPTFISKDYYGEKVCDNCMCFNGTYTVEWVVFMPEPQYVHTGCHEVTCHNGAAYVSIHDIVLQCPKAGGKVGNILGFKGNITCPNYEVLCGKDTPPCLNGCFGFGKCVNGECVCDEKHLGVDCSKPCDVSCNTCSGQPENCLSCVSQSQTLSNNRCTCPNDQIFDIVKKDCKPLDFVCDPSCATCFGPETTSCLTCKGASFLGFDYSCQCAIATYLDVVKGDCAPCHITCNTCLGPGAEDCTECVSYIMSLPEGVTRGKCVCNSMFYMTASYYCKKCRSDCVTCENDSSCLSCNPASGSTLVDGKCECPSGQFSNWGYCLNCHHLCATCDTPLPFSCLTCSLATATVAISGMCTCQDHFFLSADGSECLECHPMCKSCFGPGDDQCLVCRDNFEMVEGGMCSCGVGMYVMDQMTCGNCDPMCATCSGPGANNCLTCSTSGAIANLGSCVCPARQYMSADGLQCVACDQSCKECLGAGTSMCSACVSPLSLASKAPSSCVCTGNYYSASNGSCLLNCSQNCLSCTGSPTNCISCDMTTSRLSLGKCMCLPSSYKSATGQCLPCHSSCKTCAGDGPNQCLSCASSKNKLKGRAPNACVRSGSSHMVETDVYSEEEALPKEENVCSMNFGPAVISGVLLCVGAALTVILGMRGGRKVVSIPNTIRSQPYSEGEVTTQNKKAIAELNEEEPVVEEKRGIKEVQVIESAPIPVLSWRDNHLLWGLFRPQSNTKEWYAASILTATVLCEMCVIGLFYEEKSTDESESWGKVISTYSLHDAKYVFAALSCGFVLSLLLLWIFRASERKQKSQFAIIFAGTVCALLVCGVAYVSSQLCFTEAGRWSVSVFPLLLGEISINQTLSALLRSFSRSVQ